MYHYFDMICLMYLDNTTISPLQFDYQLDFASKDVEMSRVGLAKFAEKENRLMRYLDFNVLVRGYVARLITVLPLQCAVVTARRTTLNVIY